MPGSPPCCCELQSRKVGAGVHIHERARSGRCSYLVECFCLKESPAGHSTPFRVGYTHPHAARGSRVRERKIKRRVEGQGARAGAVTGPPLHMPLTAPHSASHTRVRPSGPTAARLFTAAPRSPPQPRSARPLVYRRTAAAASGGIAACLLLHLRRRVGHLDRRAARRRLRTM